jgi:ATP:corrinoid adenosyltransferase
MTPENNDNDDEINRRANEKSALRKAARDKMMAAKTQEKGLLIVHTGKGKGKSTAAFGMVMRSVGHGFRSGVIQFVRAAGTRASAPPGALSRARDLQGEWGRASPGRLRIARAISRRPAPPGPRRKR